jgi:hypothetical protein
MGKQHARLGAFLGAPVSLWTPVIHFVIAASLWIGIAILRDARPAPNLQAGTTINSTWSASPSNYSFHIPAAIASR